ncbi:TonB-dependent siderophore receptor [Comamonadaceae bacterium PP-2]
MSATALGVALTAVLAHSPAQAQVPVAPAARQVNYSIPAGPLAPALRTLASRADLLLTFTEAQTAGKTTSGVEGSYTPAAALAALLAGTGLQAAPLDNGAYVLRAAPAAPAAAPGARGGETVLGAVTVTAQRDLGAVTEGTGSLTTGSTSAATGMNLSLRDTPQSVTVITRERMDQQALGSFAEVAEQVPGVFFSGSGTPIGGRTWIYSRGYMVNSYQVDGVNVPWEAMGESSQYGHGSLDTAIYDSVAVVRGATGLLTGAGDPSASVSLTRKKPTRAFQGSVEGSLGRWDRRRAVADVGGPLNAAGSLRGRFVGAHDEGKTWVERYSNEKSIVYGVLEADIGPQTLATLSLEHTRDSSKGAPWASIYGVDLFYDDGITPTPANRHTNMAPHWAFSDNDRTSVTAAVEHRINADWTTRLSYGYSEFNGKARRGMVNGIPADGSPTTARVVNLESVNKVQTVDGKVDGRYTLLGREHDLIAGFNLTYSDLDLPVAYYGVHRGFASWNGSQIRYGDLDWDALDKMPQQTETRSHGAYLATRLRPTERLSTILGGRLSDWTTRVTEFEPETTVTDDRRYSHEFTPYVGVVFDLSPSLSAYASYTEIFNPQSNKDVDGRLLDPEKGSNREIGLKGEWFDGRLNGSIAVFQTRKDNLAVQDGDNETPTGDIAYRAEDDTKGRGWEIEVAGELARGWQVQGGYTRFMIRDSAGLALDTTQPVHQLKLYTSYQPAAWPKLTVGGGVRWQSKTYAAEYEGPVRQAYTNRSFSLVNLYTRYELTQKLSLSVNLNNAFDKRFRTSTYGHTYGAARNLNATMKYQF